MREVHSLPSIKILLTSETRPYLINLLQTSVRQVDILCTPKQSKCSLHESESHFFMIMRYGSSRITHTVSGIWIS